MSESSLPTSMPVLVWEAPHRMTLRQGPLPVPQPDEVLIRVAYAGICGSELSGYLGHNALRVPPLVMGHEFSGEIVALGEQVQARSPRLNKGQRVTANPMVFCGTCDYCLSGTNHLCLNRRLVGAHRPGAFAGYTTIPSWMVLPLPEGMGLREGALAEPVAVSVRIGRWAGRLAGETVLITGAGTIGLLTMQVLRQAGAARIFVTDTDADRLSVAGELGAETLNPLATDVVKTIRNATDGKGAAAAVDAVGKAVTRDECVKSVRPGGKVILSGLHEEISTLPVADVIRREVTLHGSFCYTPEDFQDAAALLAQGSIRLDPWIIEAPLAEGGDWFERLSGDKPGKVAKVLLAPPQ